MVIKFRIFKSVHNTWPPRNGKPGGESYDLLCQDDSNPPEHRMEEMLYYRTKPEEREQYFVNSADRIIHIGVSRIIHAAQGGRATLLGSIIPEPVKK